MIINKIIRQSKRLLGLAIVSGFLFLMPQSIWAQQPKEVRISRSNNNAEIKNTTKALRGFIVSDAHFGWENDNQPSPEKQEKMIKAIRHRFPGLDLFIDTGDAHHNGNDRDDEMGIWSDIIMYQKNPIPFFYIPGNHEIAHANNADVEFRSAMLGSHELRPYYSFDIKGIHFVSVPELLRAVYIPRELIEWLKLDLELNKDKTTILLSHNNLIGYSKTFEEGYRGVVNTNQIVELMEQYPNCVAWMYGHNHNYEVVRKNNKLFVSNGRIGGFDPSRGKHGLGGIYFEVTKDKVEVRSYSAEFDKFVDELDESESFQETLKMTTSFNAQASAAYSAGIGMSRDASSFPLYSHYISESPVKHYIKEVEGSVINEDPDFTMFMVRNPNASNDRQLMGSSVTNNKTSYEWMNPGIKMLASGKSETITIPRKNHSQYTYYRVASGKDYKVTMDLQGLEGGGQKIKVIPKLSDRQGKEIVATSSAVYILNGQRQQIIHPIKLSEQRKIESIYTDKNSDNVFNISIDFEFEKLDKPVEIYRIALEFENAASNTVEPWISVNDKPYHFDKKINQKIFYSPNEEVNHNSRSVITTNAKGNGMLTWLYQRNKVIWQILGASCEQREKSFVIGPLRNTLSHRKEIAINPMKDYRNSTFVSRTRGIDKIEIFPFEKGNKTIEMKIIKVLSANPEIEVWSLRSDLKIENAKRWSRKDNRYIIEVEEGTVVKIK